MSLDFRTRIFRFSLFIIHLSLLFACAPSAPKVEYVGSVGKQKITREDYMNEYGINYNLFVQRYNTPPSPQQRRELADATFERIVDGYIIADLFKRHDITVSARELLDTLRTNVPELLLNSPRFRNDKGEFDRERYIRSLQTDNPEDLSSIRQSYATTIIPHQKLRNLVVSQRHISDREIEDFYRLMQVEVTADIYTITPDDISDDEIMLSDKDIEDYYRKHQDDFYAEATVDLNWVLFSVEATEKDLRNIAMTADSLYKEVLRGRRFTLLASDFSAPPYNRLGGSAGYVELAELDFEPHIIQQLTIAPVGYMTEPFLYKDAWWILQIDDKTVNMIKLNIIKLDLKPSKETIDANRRKMERFTELQFRIGFARTANELGLTLHNQKGLSLTNSTVAGIGDIEPTIRFALNQPEKHILPAIRIPDSDDYIIFQVDKKTDRNLKSIFAVIDDITARLKVEKMGEVIMKKAQEATLNSITDPSRTTLSYHDRKGYPQKFILEILKTNEGQVTSVHFDRNIAYFAVIVAKSTLENTMPLATQRHILRTEIQNLDKDDYYREWLEKQMRRYKRRDWRKETDF